MEVTNKTERAHTHTHAGAAHLLAAFAFFYHTLSIIQLIPLTDLVVASSYATHITKRHTHSQWTAERPSLNGPDQRFQLDGLLSCQIKSATKMCLLRKHFGSYSQ